MPDELRALARFAFDELARAPGAVGEVHAAIASRAFRGPRGPWRDLHDAISGATYASVGGALGLGGRVADAALAGRAPERALSTHPRGAAALAAVNGLVGDELERRGSDLQEPMAARVDGRVAGPEAFADGTARVAVFVHGLFETEHAWWFGGREPYGARLARDAGFTPIHVRYNSGRHVSQNGASLAALLETLLGAWPVPVREVVLVGHSMGGLVVRSACHQGAAAWTRRVSHVVSLGTPHTGAPIEQAIHVAGAALHAVPETRPLAALLRRRSAGIRDLRRGTLVDEDWRGRDPDALRAAAHREVPLLAGARHCFVSATVTRNARHPVGRVVGDWLVLEPSATARAQETLHLGGAHHLALLNHPAVYAQLASWLGPAPPAG